MASLAPLASLAFVVSAIPAWAGDCPSGTTPHRELRAGQTLEWCEDRHARAQGPFRSLHPDGSVAIEGRLHTDGCAEGEWRARYANGKPAWRGAFSSDETSRKGCWQQRGVLPSHPEA